MSLEWTRERPHASGYYWFVDVHDFEKPDVTPQVVRIRNAYEHEPSHVTPPRFYVDVLQQAQSDPLDQRAGCWYGPIIMPEFKHCPGW